ncbi:hypothetical protein LOZ80_26090 [Paenibacillus sp. HWE-109]|uniref:hypothetical protein n=1 Tax=Paenibacillus sp. HWE-109 TaxID=1306526 RepID=UPI001EDEACE3|nr:hypothetical protein [Paenibacillus sp. HWE-109]UKS25051.1 hypothetical protein LOZ80_26090 [Paenibacillus sp. HWE-109]
MEAAIDFSTYMQPVKTEKSTTTEMMVSRQAQEVQMAMFVAKQFPRDEFTAFNRIMKACERKILAEQACYEFPRGGQKVTGPSIRLAEVVAQNWGNIDFGVIELEQKPGVSKAMSYAWDLETNVRQTKIFDVRHERKAKGSISKLDDPRDIYELVANNGARRLRACILGVIPGDVIDAAVEKCKQTMASGNKEPLSDRIRTMIVMFEKEHQVNQSMLEKFIGCKADAFSEQDLVRLRNVFKTLRDGMGKREDYFEIKGVQKSSAESTGSNIIEGFDEYLKKTEGSNNADPNQSELPL